MHVAQDEQGRGIGGMLLRQPLVDADAHGIWTIQSSILPENAASIRLHRREGFRVVGTRARIAQMPEGTRRATVLMEWRSPILGCWAMRARDGALLADSRFPTSVMGAIIVD